MFHNQKLNKIWSIASTAVVILAVIVAVLLMGLRLFGYQVFNVVSGSMEPTYSVGDLIYVKEVDPELIQVGDPITFVLNEDLVVATHRVIEIDGETRRSYTNGDANDTADAAPVHYNNVIGVPELRIPLLGFVSNYIQHPPGTYVAVAIGALLIAAVFLPDLLKKENKAPKAEET